MSRKVHHTCTALSCVRRCAFVFDALQPRYRIGFLICQFRAKIVCHCKPHVFFFPQHELELPDEENDDVKDEARDNELDASESARTSCSGFISMSRRGGRRRCQR